MKLPKEVYKYVEYELFHYDIYKEELALERERILEESRGVVYGVAVSGGTLANPTEHKAIQLVESMAILYLERIIRAVDNALTTKEHSDVFHEFYRKRRRDLYLICGDLGMTRSTFYRYRSDIIGNVARELGIIKPGFSWKA